MNKFNKYAICFSIIFIYIIYCLSIFLLFCIYHQEKKYSWILKECKVWLFIIKNIRIIIEKMYVKLYFYIYHLCSPTHLSTYTKKLVFCSLYKKNTFLKRELVNIKPIYLSYIHDISCFLLYNCYRYVFF